MKAIWLVCAVALSGCLGQLGEETQNEDKGTMADGPSPADFRSYLHNLTEPNPNWSFANAIVEQVLTDVGGGIEIDTWIARPPGAEGLPIVLDVTPYYTGGEPSSLGRLGNELIPRGYAVGVSSVRGTGNSGGCFTQAGPSEARDTAAVVENVAKLSWSNGKVGLIGVSYDGTAPQDAWVEAPPSLKTIVPIAGISDMYKYNFVNGVHINVQGFGFNTYYWVLEGPATWSPTDTRTLPGALAGEACTEQVDVQTGGVSSTVDGNKDAYWQVRDFVRELEDNPDQDRASVFYIHGLQDWNVKPHNMEDWLDAVWASGVPMKVWLGQWGHAWPASTSESAQCSVGQNGQGAACRMDWWDHALVAWFDHWLKGIDTGIMDAPLVQVQDDNGEWRHEERWPPTEVEWMMLGLEGGKLVDGPGAASSVAYHDGSGGLVVPPGQTGQVVWQSDVLEEDLYISGMPVFHANVTADGHRASLVLTLAESTADGQGSFNFAAQSLNHVGSLVTGDETIAGLRQEVEVKFFPQEDVVSKGSRLVLIASGNTVGGPGPSLQPVSDGGLIRIDQAGAWLKLPVDRTVLMEHPQPYENAE